MAAAFGVRRGLIPLANPHIRGADFSLRLQHSRAAQTKVRVTIIPEFASIIASRRTPKTPSIRAQRSSCILLTQMKMPQILA
jgi:hypothetical protein